MAYSRRWAAIGCNIELRRSVSWLSRKNTRTPPDGGVSVEEHNMEIALLIIKHSFGDWASEKLKPTAWRRRTRSATA